MGRNPHISKVAGPSVKHHAISLTLATDILIRKALTTDFKSLMIRNPQAS